MQTLRIGFIGAGNVNFGGGEGPWDHASRLEQIEGLQVVGVADPDVDRARAVLAQRSAPLFKDTRVYPDYGRLLEEARPQAVWIGVPPDVHGVAEDGHDIELTCARRGTHMFVEKPLASARPEAVRPVAEAVAASGVLVSVGYMFRYHRAVERIREILAGTPGGVRAFIARYNCAYSEIRKGEWWDVRRTGGPLVEQATHFIDLARFLVGEADLASIRALAIPGDSPTAGLVDIPTRADGKTLEQGVPLAYRVSRATVAVWRFGSGAVGTLQHGALLHREKYETELEIWGDGLRLVLADPYGDCRLLVRRPGSEETVDEPFEDSDPYLAEDRAFIEALRGGDPEGIRCSYEDALRTHELGWALTDAARGAKA